LALPRGGVAVAREVAEVLGLPMDVIVTRKIGYPPQPELGVGAIAEGLREPVYDPRLLSRLHLAPEDLSRGGAAEGGGLRRRGGGDRPRRQAAAAAGGPVRHRGGRRPGDRRYRARGPSGAAGRRRGAPGPRGAGRAAVRGRIPGRGRRPGGHPGRPRPVLVRGG